MRPPLMFIKYMCRFTVRIIIFFSVLAAYLFYPDHLTLFVEFQLFDRFNITHVLWLVLMSGMVAHLIPESGITMGGRKSRPNTYHAPESSYDKLELLEYVQSANLAAWRVMLIWLAFNSIFALLYLGDIIGESELILLSMFYYMCDTTCMMIYCPFQRKIMKNRCCVNCRIFDWGHFMMYTPLILIRSFFSWSLFFMACVVLLRWEIVYAKHPERFWSGSNTTIRCENCKDKICYIKKPYIPKQKKTAQKN